VRRPQVLGSSSGAALPACRLTAAAAGAPWAMVRRSRSSDRCCGTRTGPVSSRRPWPSLRPTGRRPGAARAPPAGAASGAPATPGSPSSLVPPISPSIRSTPADADTSLAAAAPHISRGLITDGIQMFSRVPFACGSDSRINCSSPVLRLHPCWDTAHLRDHRSHERKVPDRQYSRTPSCIY